MKTISLLCAVLAAAFTGRADDKPDAKAPDSKRVQGVWKPSEATMGGVALPPPVLKSITLKIDGDNYEVTVAGEPQPDKGTVTLDDTATPKRMSIKSVSGPNKGKTFPAIYELKDDGTMRVCYDLSGAKHPAEFKSLPDTLLFYAAYKKEPAAEDPAAAIAAIQKLGGDVRMGAGGLEAVGLDKVKLTAADLAHLKALPSIQTLSLRFTGPGAGMEHLVALKNLQSLYLPGSNIDDTGMEQIGKMPALVNLYLQETKLTDAGLAHLKNMATLRILYLDQTKTTDAGLAHLKGLTNLVGLYLSDTAVTDAGLENLKGMARLAFLDLRKTKVTAEGIKKLKESLPRCDIKQ